MIHAMLWVIALVFWLWVIASVLGAVGFALGSVYESLMLEYAKGSTGQRLGSAVVMVLWVAFIVWAICVKFG